MTGLDRTVHPLRLHLKLGERSRRHRGAGGRQPAALPDPGRRRQVQRHPNLDCHDPWASDVLTGLHPEAPVLLMGGRPDDGRYGECPARPGASRPDPYGFAARHAAASPSGRPARAGDPGALSGSATALTRMLRAQAKAAHAAGGNWRAVVDALAAVHYGVAGRHSRPRTKPVSCAICGHGGTFIATAWRARPLISSPLPWTLFSFASTPAWARSALPSRTAWPTSRSARFL